MVERRLAKAKVAGSSPVIRSIKSKAPQKWCFAFYRADLRGARSRASRRLAKGDVSAFACKVMPYGIKETRMFVARQQTVSSSRELQPLKAPQKWCFVFYRADLRGAKSRASQRLAKGDVSAFACKVMPYGIKETRMFVARQQTVSSSRELQPLKAPQKWCFAFYCTDLRGAKSRASQRLAKGKFSSLLARFRNKLTRKSWFCCTWGNKCLGFRNL